MKIILLTDTHITTSESLWGLNPSARLSAAIDDINQYHADAAAAVVLGDIADKGDVASYELAQRLFARLAIPHYLLAGNHDRRENFKKVFPLASPLLASDDDNFRQARLELPAATFLLLDTVVQAEDSDAGEYCKARAAWLDAQLKTQRADNKTCPVILAMHHHPLAVELPEDRIRLNDNSHLAAAIRAALTRPAFIVCGHGHANIAANWLGIPLAMLRATVQQGYFTAPNYEAWSYTHGQPVYGVMHINADGVVLHYHSYLDNEVVGSYS